jgi:hypothetical protein
VKKVKAKGKERSKNKSKNIYIYLAVAVAIAVIAFSAIEQIIRPRPPKASAANYFKAEGIPIDWDTDRSTDQVLYLLQIQLNLTAVGGDAHHIVIPVPGMVPQDQWPYIQELKQNTTESIIMPEDNKFQVPVRAEKNATSGYFEFQTSIDCDEASGKITVFLKE